MWTIPDTRTSDIKAQNLVTVGDVQYAAWVMLDGGLSVARRNRSGWTWETVEITGTAATALGLPFEDDDHNFPAFAVDSTGVFHLFANMHNDPLRYVTSSNFTTWTAGTLPGTYDQFTYPIPLQLPDGRIWFYLRGGDRNGAFNPLSGRSDSHVWINTAGTWASPFTLFKGVDVAGGSSTDVDDATNWSAYPTFPLVEDRAVGYRIHISWCWRVDGLDGRSNILPSYAYYDSVTDDWHAIDGTTLTLPISPLDNLACQTGLEDNGEGYVNWGGLALDASGYPHMYVSTGPDYHQWWDGDSWNQELISWTASGTSRLNAYWFRGQIWVLGSFSTPKQVRFSPSTSATPTVVFGGEVPASWISLADPEAYRRFGTIEVLIPDGDTPRVFTFGDGPRMAAA